MLKLPWITEYDFIMSEFKSLITFQAKFYEMEAIAMLLCQMKAQNDQLKGFVLDLLDVVFEDMYRSLEVNDYKES